MSAALEPPVRRGVMAPEHEPVVRALFVIDPRALEHLDAHAELRRLLWGAVAVLALVLYLLHATTF